MAVESLEMESEVIMLYQMFLNTASSFSRHFETIVFEQRSESV